MNLTERTAYVGMYLADSMESAAITVVFISPEGWRLASCLDDHHPTGIDVPLLQSDGFEVGISPEVIAATTADLEDSDFFDYLTSLGVHAHLHVARYGVAPEEEPEETEAAVLCAQRNLSESSFTLFESVRASA